jgi:hypothetical protein
MLEWRLMQRYEALKRRKGSGKSIGAAARKVAVIIWHMLSEDEGFNVALMADGKPARKAEGMSRAALCAEQPGAEEAGSGEALPQAQRAAARKRRTRGQRRPVLPEKKTKKSRIMAVCWLTFYISSYPSLRLPIIAKRGG